MCSNTEVQTDFTCLWKIYWIILLHHHKSLRLASNLLRVLLLDIHILTTYTPSLHTHIYYTHTLTIHTLTTYTHLLHTHPPPYTPSLYTHVYVHVAKDSTISDHPVGYCDMTTHFTNLRECMGAGPWNLATCWHTHLPTPHPLTRKGANDEWVMLSQLFSALKKPMNSTSFYKRYSLTGYKDIIIGL